MEISSRFSEVDVYICCFFLQLCIVLLKTYLIQIHKKYEDLCCYITLAQGDNQSLHSMKILILMCITCICRQFIYKF